MKLATIEKIYHDLLDNVFDSCMPPARIFATRSRGVQGTMTVYTQYENYSELHVNLKKIKGIDSARAVVYHEMCHQYVNQYLGVIECEEHGMLWWHVSKLFRPEGMIIETAEDGDGFT